MIRGADGDLRTTEQVAPDAGNLMARRAPGSSSASSPDGASPRVTGRSPSPSPNAVPTEFQETIVSPLIDALQTGTIPVPEDVNFATLTSVELGGQAAGAATTIGILGSAGATEESAERAEGTLAGVRNQLEADGATGAELAEFDQAVTDVILQGNLISTNSPDFVPAIAQETSAVLQTASLGAFENTDPVRSQRIEAATSSSMSVEDLVDAAIAGIVAGDVPPAEGADLSGSTTADLGGMAATAADRVGRLIGQNGESADITGQVETLAAIRAQLVENGANPEQLQQFDDAITDLATQRALQVTGNPLFDEASLISNRNALQSGDFLALAPTGDLEDRVLVATQDVAFGRIAPTEGLDFSASTPTELGGTAAQAADRLGRLIGANAGAEEIAEAQGLLSAVSGQVLDNGANAVQLAEFDGAILGLVTERARSVAGSPSFDETTLRENRNALQSAELGALSDPQPDVLPSLAASADAAIAASLSGDFQAPADIDVSTLNDTELGTLLSDAVPIGITTAIIGAPTEGDPTILSLEEAQGLYGEIRNQLEEDGASPEQLAELDSFITEIIIQNGLFSTNSDEVDGSIFSRVLDLLGPRLPLNESGPGQIDAIARTNLVRDSRLDPTFFLSTDDARLVSDVIPLALASDNPAEFTDGNLSIATPAELAQLLSSAASSFAAGITRDDPEATQRGLDRFDQIRDELVRRAPGDEIPTPLIDAFETSIAVRVADGRGRTPESFQRVLDDPADLRTAVGNFTVEGNFGIASVRNFEGSNGADPASIFVIELKPGQGDDPTSNFVGHDVVVSNVIESQLQEAGQGYELTNIQAEAAPNLIGRITDPASRGIGALEALNGITDSALESGEPAFVNISLALDISSDQLQSGLQAVSDAGLFEGIDLSTEITQENIDDFSGVIREVALAAIDPERPEVVTALGSNERIWQDLGVSIQTFERAAAADLDIFVAVPNSSTQFSTFQFADDTDAAGSITRVGNNGLASALESNAFVLPDQGEDLPTTDAGTDGIPTGFEDQYYRGGAVDVYAPGFAVSGLTSRPVFGSSFATPDMLVNSILGRFNPDDETRVAQSAT